jgi:heptosyltransferase I
MRILIIKTTSLGDVVHCLPIIADIKQQVPEAQIDWVVEDGFADILKLHPHIHRIIPVAIRRWRKALFSPQTWREFSAFKRQLQAQPYDVVIDTQGLLKSAVIAYLSHSANKCGYDKSSAREAMASCFYQHKFNISYQQHAVVRNRTLAALALGYSPPTTAPDYGVMADLKRLNHVAFTLPSQYVVALHSTSRDAKCWPVEHWVALGERLQQRGLALVLPWGNAAEELRAKTIAQAIANALVLPNLPALPNPIVLPKLGITSLAAIIANAQVIVGVDTGLVHLAVALNKPTVAIYTDTNPVLTGVYPGATAKAISLGDADNIPQPDAVLQALLSLI